MILIDTIAMADGMTTMELRQLRTFRMVATTLNFTRAAASLDYVQSSVTAQIQALEEELGCPLFDRLGKRVALTEAGQRLLVYAERLLDLAREAQEAVVGGDEPSGTVTISAPESVCTYRLPALLQQMRLRYPRVRLVFWPSVVADMRRLIGEGTVDAVFMLEDPDRVVGLSSTVLAREPLVVLAPPDHPLTQASSIGPADLEGESALLTEAGCSYRALFERALGRAGIRLGTALEFGSVEAIKQCVMCGMGITVLPAMAAASEVAQGRLVVLPWAGDDLSITFQVVWHKDKWLSPALSALLIMAREMLGAPHNQPLALASH